MIPAIITIKPESYAIQTAAYQRRTIPSIQSDRQRINWAATINITALCRSALIHRLNYRVCDKAPIAPPKSMYFWLYLKQAGYRPLFPGNKPRQNAHHKCRDPHKMLLKARYCFCFVTSALNTPLDTHQCPGYQSNNNSLIIKKQPSFLFFDSMAVFLLIFIQYTSGELFSGLYQLSVRYSLTRSRTRSSFNACLVVLPSNKTALICSTMASIHDNGLPAPSPPAHSSHLPQPA